MANLPPLIGHENVQATLSQLISSGKMPHAILLQGPQGIGKRLLAEHLACRMLCGAGEGDQPLAFDISHVLYPQIEARSTPNFHILEKEEKKTVITVEQVRTLLEKLSLASDGGRAVIVDAAENMGNAAANALLKTLEEPGDGVHFILICHAPSKLLPTIISRCRQVRCTPLSESHTRRILQENLPETPPAQQETLLKLANGCPGRAISLAQQGNGLIDFWEDLQKGQLATLAPEDIANQFGKQTNTALTLLIQHIANQAKQNSSPKLATLHQKLCQKQADMLEFNLSNSMVLEQALTEASRAL